MQEQLPSGYVTFRSCWLRNCQGTLSRTLTYLTGK